MSTINVVKIGGKIAENEEWLAEFLNAFHQLKGSKILVHGGGVLASKISEKLGIQTQMLEGRRITDSDTLDVVTMVYGGLINKKLVARLQAIGQDAIGLTGADLNIIQSDKRNPFPVDFGWVGDINTVDVDWLKTFMEHGVVPVIAPLTHNKQGDLLNTNADNIAGYLAIELAKRYDVELTFCFDRPGVMYNEDLLTMLTFEEYDQFKQDDVIVDGMIPKLDLGFYALQNEVKKVRVSHFSDLLLQKEGTDLVL
ncbi:MAG: acetylglutamate kinase [Balneolaceae bacterium]|nr:acetylglutamate kinase [Balneolaceae bacterium]